MSALNTVKIENTELVRDMNSHAVLNTDAEGLQRYKEQRRRTLGAKQETLETKKRLETIEQEMVTLRRIISELSAMRSKS